MKLPTILLISHVIPYPPAAGNEIRILKMIGWLRRAGFRVVMLLNHEPITPARRSELEKLMDAVHFIGDHYKADLPPPPERGLASRLADRLALTLPDSLLYTALFGLDKKEKLHSDSVKRYLGSDRLVQVTRHLCELHRPVAVIAEYIFTAPCLDVVPHGALKIIDTHDMFSRKREQVLAHGIEDPLPCTPGEERRCLLKADVVIAIQSHEAEMFRKLVARRAVITVGIDFEVVEDADDSSVVPGTVLVVGSDNPLNRHGLKLFYEDAWRIVRAGHPDAVLRVVGKLGNDLRIDDPRVQRVGWVPDLNDEYRKAAVVINPTVAGTGLKIKSVEALCRGKALVGTPNSVEGIEAHGESPYMIGCDWNAFARAVLLLLDSDCERRALQRRAIEFARDTFSTERVYASLGATLQGAG